MSRESLTESERLEGLFTEARRGLGEVESVRADVERRVEETSVRRASRSWSVATVVLLAVAVGGGFWVWRGTGVVVPAEAEAEPAFSVRVGEEELRTHVAAMLDRRTVLMVWSGGGEVAVNAGEGRDGVRVGKYVCHALPDGRSRAGRRVCYRMYVADEGVRPALEPPTVTVDAGAGGGVVSFAVSPRAVSTADQLAAVMAGQGLTLADGATAARIFERAREYVQD